MKLLLTASGIRNKTIEATLADLLVKPFAETKAVFIATPAMAEEGDKGWFLNDMNTFYSLGFKQFDILDIAALRKNEWLPRLETADLIIVTGGLESYFMHHADASGYRDEIKELLETRVYAGISAGSTCMSDDFLPPELEAMYEEGDSMGYKQRPLFGITNFSLLVHLNGPSFPQITKENVDPIAAKMDRKLYLIDDNTAIKIDGDDLEVVSEGGWHEYN